MALLFFLVMLASVALPLLVFVVFLRILGGLTGDFGKTGERLRAKLLDYAFPFSPYEKYYPLRQNGERVRHLAPERDRSSL